MIFLHLHQPLQNYLKMYPWTLFVYPHLSGSLFSQNSTNSTTGGKSEANSSTDDLESSSHPQQTSLLTNGDINMPIVNPAHLTRPKFEVDSELLKKLEQHKKQQRRKP